MTPKNFKKSKEPNRDAHRMQEKMRHRRLMTQTIKTANLVPGLIENGKSRGTMGKTCKYVNEFVEFLQQLKNILVYETQSIQLSLISNGKDISTILERPCASAFRKIPSPQLEIEVMNDNYIQQYEPYQVTSYIRHSDILSNENNASVNPLCATQDTLASDSGYVDINVTTNANNFDNLSLADQDILLALKSYKIVQQL